MVGEITKRKMIAFNIEDQQRYQNLGLKEPFTRKVKQLFYDYCEKVEVERMKR